MDNEIYSYYLSGCTGSTFVDLELDYLEKTFKLVYKSIWMGGDGPFLNKIYGQIIKHNDKYISLCADYYILDNQSHSLKLTINNNITTVLAFRFVKLDSNIQIDEHDKEYNFIQSACFMNDNSSYNAILMKCQEVHWGHPNPISIMEKKLRLDILEHVLMKKIK